MVRANDRDEDQLQKDATVASQIPLPKSEQTLVRRPRSLTTLRLEVVAERARKMKRIKESIANNSYSIDSNKVAKILLEQFNEDDLK